MRCAQQGRRAETLVRLIDTENALCHRTANDSQTGRAWNAHSPCMCVDLQRTQSKYLLVALALTGCMADPNTPISSTHDEIIGGTESWARPEIGLIYPRGCTATLISPRAVLTAAHCVGFRQSHLYPYAGVQGSFYVPVRPYMYQPFEWDRVVSFSVGVGENDFALVHLVNPVPSSVATPAVLGPEPRDGVPATVFGFGCTNRDNPTEGYGVKRFFEHRWGETPGNLCPGDSGGPVIQGSIAGPVFAVNSGYWCIFGICNNIYAVVGRHRSLVNQILSEWECCDDPTDSCGMRGDGACQAACAWGQDAFLDCHPDCGNGRCDDGETNDECPVDCEPPCGNQRCDSEAGETCLLCPMDCGTCRDACGDGACGEGEVCDNCPRDCGDCPRCGDSVCNADETYDSCPEDCFAPPRCGDGNCTVDENCDSCSSDCGECPRSCGDDRCEGDEGCENCPRDCGACPPRCGDGACNNGEDCSSCVGDCGACAPRCGDESCNGGEDCSSCEADCGACAPRCGDASCNGSEDCSSCEPDCGACAPRCGDESCNGGEDCSSCEADCGACGPTCGDGNCDSDETCDSCWRDCRSDCVP